MSYLDPDRLAFSDRYRSGGSDEGDSTRHNSDESSGGGRESTDRRTGTGTSRSRRHKRELIVPDNESDTPFATYVLHTRQNPFDTEDEGVRSNKPSLKSLYQQVYQNDRLDNVFNMDQSHTSTSNSAQPFDAYMALSSRLSDGFTRGCDVATDSDYSNSGKEKRGGKGNSKSKESQRAVYSREDSVVSSASSLASRLSDMMRVSPQPYAEKVLMNLGFCDADSFLPKRFVNNWYEKVFLSQMSFRRDEEPESSGSTSGRSSPVTGGLESLNRVALLNLEELGESQPRNHLHHLPHSPTDDGSMRRIPPEVADKAINPSSGQFDIMESLRRVINRQAALLHSAGKACIDKRRNNFLMKRQKSLPINLETLEIHHNDSDTMTSQYSYYNNEQDNQKKSKTKEFFETENKIVPQIQNSALQTNDAIINDIKSSDTSDISSGSGTAVLSTPFSGSARTSADVESDLEKIGSDGGVAMGQSQKSPTNAQRVVRINGNIPTIIVNSVSIDQQSLSSMEVAEILNTDDSETNMQVSDIWLKKEIGMDKENFDHANSLGATGNDAAEGLLSPLPISLSVSPASVSPVTVIEVDKLDNNHDSLDSEANDLGPLSPDAMNDYEITQPNLSPFIANGNGPFLLCRPSSMEDLYDENDYLRPVCRHTIVSCLHSPCNSPNNGNQSAIACSSEAGVQEDDGRLSPIRKFIVARQSTASSESKSTQCSMEFKSVGCQVTNNQQQNASTQTSNENNHDGAHHFNFNIPNGQHRLYSTLTACVQDILQCITTIVTKTVEKNTRLTTSQVTSQFGQSSGRSMHNVRPKSQTTFNETSDSQSLPRKSNKKSDGKLEMTDKKEIASGNTRSEQVRKNFKALGRSVSFDSSLNKTRIENKQENTKLKSKILEVKKRKHYMSEKDKKIYLSVDNENDMDDVYRRKRWRNLNGSINKVRGPLNYGSVSGFGLETIISVESEKSKSSASDSEIKSPYEPHYMIPNVRHLHNNTINSDWLTSEPTANSLPRMRKTNTSQRHKYIASLDNTGYSTNENDNTNFSNVSNNSTSLDQIEFHRQLRKGTSEISKHKSKESKWKALGRAWNSATCTRCRDSKETHGKRSFDSVQTQPSLLKKNNWNKLHYRTRALSDLRKHRLGHNGRNDINFVMLEKNMREDIDELTDDSDDYCYYSNRSTKSSGGRRSVTSQTDDMSDNPRPNMNYPSRFTYNGNWLSHGYFPAKEESFRAYRRQSYNSEYHSNRENMKQGRSKTPFYSSMRNIDGNYTTDRYPDSHNKMNMKKSDMYRRKLPKTPSVSDSFMMDRRFNSDMRDYDANSDLSSTKPYSALMHQYTASSPSQQQIIQEKDRLLEEIDYVLKHGIQHMFINSDGSCYYTLTGNSIDNRICSDETLSEPKEPKFQPPYYESQSRQYGYFQAQAGYKRQERNLARDDTYDERYMGKTPLDDKALEADRAKSRRKQFWQQVAADRTSAIRDQTEEEQHTVPTEKATELYREKLPAETNLNRQESADYKKLEKVKNKDVNGGYHFIVQNTIKESDYDNVPVIPVTSANRNLNVSDKLTKATLGNPDFEKQQSKGSNISADSEGDDYFPLMGTVHQQKQESTPAVKKRPLFATYQSEEASDTQASEKNEERNIAKTNSIELKSSEGKQTKSTTSTSVKYTDVTQMFEIKLQESSSVHSQLKSLQTESSEIKSSDESEKYLTVLSNSSSFSKSSIDSNYLQVLADSDRDSNERSKTPTSKVVVQNNPKQENQPQPGDDSDSDSETNYLQVIHDEDDDRIRIQAPVKNQTTYEMSNSRNSPNCLSTNMRYLKVSETANDSTSSDDSTQNYLRILPDSGDDLSEKRYRIFDKETSKMAAEQTKNVHDVTESNIIALKKNDVHKSTSEESAEDYLQIIAEPSDDMEDRIFKNLKKPSSVNESNTYVTIPEMGTRIERERLTSNTSEESTQDYLQVLPDSYIEDRNCKSADRFQKSSNILQGENSNAASKMTMCFLEPKRARADSCTSDDSTQDYLQVIPNSDDEERYRRIAAKHKFDNESLAEAETVSTEDIESSDTSSISAAEYRLQSCYSDGDDKSKMENFISSCKSADSDASVSHERRRRKHKKRERKSYKENDYDNVGAMLQGSFYNDDVDITFVNGNDQNFQANLKSTSQYGKYKTSNKMLSYNPNDTSTDNQMTAANYNYDNANLLLNFVENVVPVSMAVPATIITSHRIAQRSSPKMTMMLGMSEDMTL